MAVFEDYHGYDDSAIGALVTQTVEDIVVEVAPRPDTHGLRNEITILSESALKAMVFTRSCASARLSGQYRSRSAVVTLTRVHFRLWIPL